MGVAPLEKSHLQRIELALGDNPKTWSTNGKLYNLPLNKDSMAHPKSKLKD